MRGLLTPHLATPPDPLTDPVPQSRAPAVAGGEGEGAATSGVTVGALRGAAVDADPRTVARTLLVIALAALAAVIAVLAVAGIRKDEQITELRDHGAAVTISVRSCRGELGGSGSNVAGYTCVGTYRFLGSSYTVTIPGDVMRAPGSRLLGVASREDPSLFTLSSALRHEQASWRVFLAPLLLSLLLVGSIGVLLTRRARARRQGRASAPPL